MSYPFKFMSREGREGGRGKTMFFSEDKKKLNLEVESDFD
jgi:hypothetical protein